VIRTLSFVSSIFLVTAASAQQQQSGDALVKALRQGGYVIVMRHASSPREVPDKSTANPDNVKPERQLDPEGRASATAMGKALRDLKIPIGAVLTSPTYRALETIRYAQFGKPEAFPELGDNGQSMQGGTEAQATWLRKKVTEFPQGTNTLIVTHMPNMSRAFPESTNNLADGEALIFSPSGVVARIKIEEWKGMVK
jgi:phosphohistidine phosphatase SixA